MKARKYIIFSSTNKCMIGGVATQKKPKKTEKNRKKPKKTSPKFEICGSVRFFSFFSAFFGFFRFFSVFFGFFRFFSVYCGTFSVFFGLNFDKKFQSFKNHVNIEAKNCLITYLMPIKPCKCLIKAIISKENHLTRSR